MLAALDAGHPVDLPRVDPFVDGAAVSRAGTVTFPIIRDSGCEVVTVSEGAVCVEMLALYQTDGIIAEPAGALATAALPELRIQPGEKVIAIVSGGNNDVTRYGEVVERALVHEGRKHYFLVEFPQEPGALRRFLDEVLGPDDDITLFEYVKHNNRETGPALVGIELGSPATLPELLARMEAAPPHVERVPPDSPLFRFIL
jgi:threonine dehydratase